VGLDLRVSVTLKVSLFVLLAASALSAQTPAITSLSVNGVAAVNAGAVGSTVTIIGTGFGTQGPSSTVTFNNLAATPVSWTATSISVSVPTGATTGNVVVNPAGTPSNPWQFVVVPGPQTPGINFVQGNYETTATSKTVSVLYPAAQVGGDLNVVAMGWRNNSCTVTSVTDNSANTYAIAVGPTHFNNLNQSIYYAKNIAAAGAGVNKVTVIFSCTGTINNDIRIAEYSDISTTNPVDVVSSFAASTSTCATPSVTTTNANDLLFGTDFLIVTPTSAGTGYTNRVQTTSLVNPGTLGPSIVEDRIVTVTGGYSASVTMPLSRDCMMQMVAFRAVPNQAPAVSAGSNQTITLPTNTATLTATATDDGLPNKSLTLAWTQVSGPGTATFGTPTAASTQVTVPQVAGTYLFKLTANDSSLSTSATMTLTVNPVVVNLLVSLTPTFAGPNVAGTTQKMTAVVTSNGTAVAGAVVHFTVTGTNPTSGNGTTDATGTAPFTYTGALKGTDTVQASNGGSTSNTASVSWIVPVQPVSTTTVFGRFFTSDAAAANTGIFDALPTMTPVFSQEFPTINFDPPPNVIPGNTSGINYVSRPFADVTTDINGNFTGIITAQGNGFQAGVGVLGSFQAVFTGSFTIASAGNVTFNFFSDDGFVLGVSGGATHVSGPMINVPAGGVTPFQNYTVVGSFNQGSSPTGNVEVVNFPAPGTYQYEIDYTECCGFGLSLTMGIGATNGPGTSPTGSLALSPVNPASIATGQVETLTAQATDGSGLAVPSTLVTLTISGANPQTLTTTTDATGKATFQYSGVTAGSDTVQAIANISSQGTFSNLVVVPWSASGGGTVTLVQQGWIGAPLIGTVVQGQVPITVASGVTLTSGTLKYFPTSNTSAVTILNSNTTGTGTIGTFDATLLPNGGYTIQLDAVSSTGATQRSIIAVIVTGENKPGRVRTTVTDFKVPLAGIPINIARTYDSLVRSKVGDFGQGWSLDVGVDLSVDAFNNVTFTFNKQRITFNFTPQSTGSALFAWLLVPHYTPAPGFYGSLTSDGCNALVQVQNNVVCFPSTATYQPTTFTYTDPSGRVYVISATGQIQSIKDLNGTVLTIAANGISSSVNGVVVPFVRDTSGRIKQITDLNGKIYTYGYDTSGNLQTVQYPTVTAATVYGYLTDHSLNSVQDPRGASTSATYYPDGRLQSVTGPTVSDASGNPVQYVTQYAYNVGTRTTTITNPDGGAVTRVDDAFGKPVSIAEQVDSTTMRTTTYQYDASENLASSVDACGNGSCADIVGTAHTTTYKSDANGFQTSVTDPLGHTSTKSWNQFGGVTISTDAANTNTETSTYFPNFNLQQVIDLQNGPNSLVRSFTYDGQGNVATVADANGKVTTFGYDPNGNLHQVIDALNETTTYNYDVMGRLKTLIDPLGVTHTTTNTYDDIGNLKTKIDAMGNQTTYGYDNNSNQTSVLDGNNHSTQYQYDNLNRLTLITYPDTTTNKYTYDFRNNKLTETDQGGHVTRYGYDLAGQLTGVTSGFGTIDAGTVSYAYDLSGRRSSETDERGNKMSYTYDVAGNLITITDALNHTTNIGYDADNRKTSVRDANLNTTKYAYDLRSRLSVVTYPIIPPATVATTTRYNYDGESRLLTTTDQAGLITTNTYDDVGRLKTIQDALPTPSTTTYSYDFAGNLTLIKDGNQHLTTFAPDFDNRRASRQLPLNQIESYTYDGVGMLKTKVDFNGKTTTYNYDMVNRLLSKVPDSTLSQPTVSFTYTPTGQRLTMTDVSGTSNYTSYDNRDRLKTKVTSQGTLNYTYDAHNNVASIISSNLNGASMSYSYDALNRLSQVCDNKIATGCGAAGVTTYSYDAAGNWGGYLNPNIVQNNNVFDQQNRLTQACSATTSPACSATTKIASFAYTLGAAGNRTMTVDLNTRTATYGYDNDYRLTSEAITADPGGKNGTVGYTQFDGVGNRQTMTSTLSGVPAGTFTYDANDRLMTDSYDNNGNTTSSGGITRTYDFENHLTGYGAVAIQNDGDGNRVLETIGGVTTKYLVDTLNPTGYAQVMDEVVGTAVQRTYTYGLNRISENQLVGSTWTPAFYGYDGHGNARFLTNTAGAVTDTYTYDAYGVELGKTGATANNYLYSAEQLDSTLGLYYLRARYYWPATGRFQTADPPKRGSCCRSGSCPSPWSNPYIYANSDPVDLVDPAGLDAAGVAFLYRNVLVPVVATGATYSVGVAAGCELDLAACRLSALASKSGWTWGKSRCDECYEWCKKLGYWPYFAKRVTGRARCDYWK